MASLHVRAAGSRYRLRAMLAVCAAATIVATARVDAAFFIVNTTADTPDTNPGDGIAADINGQVSLRAAIMEANAQPVGAPHTIQFAPHLAGATIFILLPGIGEDNSLVGDLDILADMTISGLPPASMPGPITIDGGNLDRIFDVHNASVTIENLRIIEGAAPPLENGGGIRFAGATNSLVLRDVLLYSHFAENGGAVHFDGASALFNNTTFEANGSMFDGGAVYLANTLNGNAVMTINQGELVFNAAGNLVTPGDGGAIYTENGSTLIVNLSLILGNDAQERGGGVAVGGSATANFTETTIMENEAALGGGVRTGGFTTFTRCRIMGNVALGPPLGAVPGTAGGGIFAFGNLTKLIDTTVQFNLVDSGNPIDMGGGLLVDIIGTVEATGCTFDHNTAGAPTMGYGGGIGNIGRLTLNNCTVSSNLSNNIGGGVYNFAAGGGGNLNCSYVTIAVNHATNQGGGIYQDVNIPFNMLATIVARNTIYDAAAQQDVPQNFAAAPGAMPLTDHGYNLDEDGTCALTDPTSIIAPAGIGPLMNNGGPTETHALLPFSPAIDHVGPCIDFNGALVMFDQRGVSRPVDGNGDGIPVCDIGAYEFEPTVLPPINDLCIDAATVTLNPSMFTFDTTGATNDGPAEPCGFTGVNDADVWMMIVAPCNGIATLTLTAAFDRLLAVYTDCPFAGGVQIGCGAGIGPMPAIVTIPTIAGQVYIVRVGGMNGATGTATIDYSFQSCAPDIAPQGFVDCVVNVQDLLEIINSWGQCPQPCPPFCAADINHDCAVSVTDLLAVINGWGPCP